MAAQTKTTRTAAKPKSQGKAKPKAVRGSAKPSPPPVEVVEAGPESALKKLTDKQRLFVEFYLGESYCNATDAARRAGYSDPEMSGWENKQKLVIQEAIQERVAEVAMSADEVLLRLRDHGRGSLKPFLTEEGFIDITTDEAQQNIGLLKEIEVEKRVGGPEDDPWIETKTKIKLHDPQAALVHLGRHHKLFTDKTENATSVKLEVTAEELNDDELASIAAAGG